MEQDFGNTRSAFVGSVFIHKSFSATVGWVEARNPTNDPEPNRWVSLCSTQPTSNLTQTTIGDPQLHKSEVLQKTKNSRCLLSPMRGRWMKAWHFTPRRLEARCLSQRAGKLCMRCPNPAMWKTGKLTAKPQSARRKEAKNISHTKTQRTRRKRLRVAWTSS